MMYRCFAFVLMACITGAVGRHCFDHCTSSDVLTCATSFYACGSNEYCEVFFDKNADTPHFNCHNTNRIQHCQEKQVQNSPACDLNHKLPHTQCYWCCAHRDCLIHLASGSVVTGQPIVTGQPDVTGQPVVTQAPTTTAAVPTCIDIYSGNCGNDFANRCDEPIVQQICQNYCDMCA